MEIVTVDWKTYWDYMYCKFMIESRQPSNLRTGTYISLAVRLNFVLRIGEGVARLNSQW